jgi:uncharacterized repeat protein (TIGR01451 family)
VNFKLRTKLGLRAVVATALVSVGLAVFAPVGPASAASRTFAIRPTGTTTKAQFTTTGDIVFVSNTVMSCATSATSPPCAAVRAGTFTAPATATSLANNNNYMTNIDVDTNGTTFNSSSSNLTIPAGGSVLFAGLYWGAKTTAGTTVGGVVGVAAPTPADKNKVLFATPTSAGAYTTLTSNTTGTAASVDLDPGVVSSAYGGYADVTATVQAAGAGTYTVANIQTATGGDRYGGWTIVVILKDPAQPMRQLTVFDGLEYVTSPATSPTVISISGFQAPPVGPVQAKLGVVAFEGDLGNTGDALTLNSTALTDGTSPVNDFFNSTIANSGTAVGTKSPNYVNQLGYDADIISTSGIVGPGATSATVSFSSSGDVYYPQVLTTAIDVYSPKFIAGVGFTKTAADVNGGNLEPGDVLRYTITVKNTGQDNSINTVLNDAIPANATFVPGSLNITAGANTGAKTDTAGDDQADFVASPAAVVFRLGAGANGTAGGLVLTNESATVTFDVKVNAGTPHNTLIANTAKVTYTGQTSGITDTASSPSTSSTVVYASDLSLTKSHVGSIVPGTNVSYSLAATNGGPTPVPGTVTITDTLPAGLTYVPTGSGGGPWVCGAVGGVVTCTAPGPIAVGALPAVTIVAAVDPGVTGSITNNASVGSAMTDPNLADNAATDTATVVSKADITMAKSHTGALVPGGTATYTLTIANPTGPSTAQGPLTIVEGLPTGLTMTGYVGTGWTCLPGTATGAATVTCTKPGTLAVGASSSVDINVTIDPALAGTLSNSANASSTSTDPVPANNSATDGPAALAPSSDLAVTKSHTGSIISGSNVTYTVAVKNNGVSVAATPIKVIDTLPTGLSFVSSPTSGWSCTGTTTVTCTRVAPLGVGATATVDLVVAVANSVSGSITNSASATSSSTDPTPANNIGTDTATVVSSADLSLTKAHTGAITAGSNVVYHFVALNSGPSGAAGPITITDTLPTGLSVVSASAGWSCTPTTGTVVCTNPASISSGATNVLDLTVAVDSAATGSITNTATVGSPTSDPVPGNNGATDGPSTIATSADIVVTKSHAGTVVAGTNTTYTIAVNNVGPSNAAGPITAIDTLPSGLTYVSSPTAGWSCGASGATVTCTQSAGIAAGATSNIDLVVGVASSTSGSVTNSAVANSTTTDPTPANNTGTDTAAVTAKADLELAKSHVGPITAGSQVTYNLAVKNNGPSASVATVGSPIVVTDTLPAGLAFASAIGTGWTCSAVGAVVTCNRVGTIANGATSTVAITANVAASLVAGTVANSATITTAPTPDPIATNNSATDSATSTTSADLSATKSHAGLAVAGNTVSYTVNAHNAGPSVAADVTLTDAVPTGFTFVSAAGVGWSCALAAGSVGCTHGPLAVGADAPVTIVFAIDPLLTGVVANIGTLSSTTPDPAPSNDSSTDNTPLSAVADISIAKSVSPALVAGGTATYTITVKNVGPSVSRNATVTDPIPAGVTVTGPATGAGWSCVIASGTLTCTAATLAIASTTITFPVSISASASGAIPNTASITSTTPDPTLTDHTATDPGPLTSNADLSITKTHVGAFTAGTNATYNLSVSNAGPSDASAVTIADTLPAGFTFVSSPTAGWLCSGSTTVTCTNGALANGAALPLQLVVAIASGTSASATNSATVSSPTTDPALSNNTSTDGPTPVGASADLSITKAHAGPLVAGVNSTYTVTVTNSGPSTAAGPITVTDSLPAGMTFVSTSSPGWSCGGTTSVTCTRAASIAMATSVPLVLVVSVASGALAGPANNTASVSSPTGDPDLANNSATDTGTIIKQADVAVTKAHSGVVVPGTNTTFTIGVKNLGPSDVDTITIGDPLPVGFTFVSGTGSGWTCSGSTTVSCTHGSLVVDASAPITLVVAVASSVTGAITNAITKTSTPDDPNTANDTATDGPFTPVPSADLAVTKSHIGAIVAGTNATYSVSVKNNGPSDAASATVLDTLPVGLTFVSSPTVGWSCSGTTLVSCVRGPISSGATSTVDIIVAVAANVTGTVTNNVVVSSTTPDPTPGNNAAADGPVTVGTSADLAVTKSHTGSLTAGSNATFTVAVKNNGPSDAANATVTDALPVGITFVSSPTVGWSCSGSTTVTCTHATIANGATTSVDLLVAVASSLTGNVTNTATVTSTTPDPTAVNNAGSDGPITIFTSANLALAKSHVGTFTAGTNATYTLTVNNLGPSGAADVTVTDTLPSSFTFVSTPTAGWSCSGTTTVICSGGAIANGAATSVDIVVAIASNVTGTATNSAIVTSTTPDPTPANNTAADGPAPIATSADLSMTKGHSGVFLAGTNTTYSLSVHNAGPSATADLKVVDVLTTGLTFVSSPTAGWSCTGSTTVTCTSGPLANGADASVDIVVAIASTVTGSVVNAATASSTTPDPDSTNNTGTRADTAGASADLTVTKSHTGAILAGTNVTYTVSVKNNGPSQAATVTVNDPLPTGMTFVSTPSAGWVCGGTTTVTCTGGPLANSATVTLDLVVAVAANVTGTVTNSATVFSSTPDPDTTNNTGTDGPTTLTTSADLSTTKSHVGAITAGTNTTYTIVVKNNGPSDAADATIVDALPTGFTFVATSSAGWSCGGTTSISCARGVLASGASSTLAILVSVATDATGTVTNTATVSSTTPDPDITNNKATDGPTTITTSADLSATKSHAGALVAGTNATFTVSVKNNGVSDAADAKVVDTLPGGVTFISSPSTGWSCGGTTVVTCTHGALASGATSSVDLLVAIAPGATGTLTNQATVSSTTPDPDLTNNKAVDGPAPVGTSADLAVTKSHTGTLVAGTTATFTIAVKNNGPSAAADATVIDALPAGVMFVSTASAGWTCSGTFSVSCSYGLIASGATATLDVVVALAANVTGSISNTASVTSTTGDPTPGNNSATDGPSTITTSSDLAVTKSHTGPVVAGTNVTYSISVKNNGPSDSADAKVIDTLPTGLTFVSSPSPGWSCTGSTTVACTHGTIANGATSVVDLVVAVATNATGSVTNSVVVSTTTPDPTPLNNTATDGPTTIVTKADVSLTKTLVGILVAGTNVTYSLKAHNAGPSDTVDLTVNDPLPSGLTFVSSSTAGWSCGGTTTVTCTHGPLVNGADATVDIVVAVVSTATGSILNSATASSTTPDSDLTNNVGKRTAGVGVAADLSVSKSHTGPILAGTNVTYTVSVKNNGPSQAADVSLSDPLPTGFTFVSTASAGWSCSGTTTVSCSAGPLANGATTSVDLVVAVAANVLGSVSNSVTVSSTTQDQNITNNVATDGPTPVTTRADLSVSKTHVGAVVAGTNTTYYVSVRNNGPSDAADATVVDTLPAGFSFVSTSSAGWSCGGTATVTCSHGLVANGATVTVALVVAVASNVTGSVTNSVVVSTTTADPTVPNNTATDGPTAIVTSSDLSATKIHGGSLVAGTNATFTVSVKNNGPSDAADATVGDPLPTGVTFVSTSSAGWSCGGTTTVTCTHGPIVNGATATVDLLVAIASTATGTLTNRATVSSTTPDPTPLNNVASDGPSPVNTSADLQVTKVHAGTLVAGTTTTYTIAVSNFGPSAAADASVTDILPAGMTFVSTASSGWSCGGTTTVVCTHGLIPTSTTTNLDLVVALAANMTGSVSNTATVTSTTADPTPANNKATDGPTPVTTSANVSLTKSHVGPIVAGANVTYSLTTTNAGPSDAADLTVTDTLPPNMTFVSTTSSGWSCSGTTTVSCTHGALVFGASSTVDLVVFVAANAVPATATNAASVSSSTPDPLLTNNSTTDPGPITLSADLSLKKLPAVGPFVAGTAISWTIQVHNNGPSDAPAVVVNDAAPSGLNTVTASSSQGSCTTVVVCSIGTMANGATVSITVSGIVSPSYVAATMDNTADVSSGAPDPKPADNTKTVSSPIGTVADLTISKSATPTRAVPGSPITWTIIVRNNGPSDAQAVAVNEVLPAQISGVVTGSSQGSCVGTTCSLGTLPVNGTATITVDALVDPALQVAISNTATVTSSTTDPNVANNSVTLLTKPDVKADLTITKVGPTGPVVPGTPVLWTLTVHNSGPSASFNTHLLDPIVPGTLLNVVGTPSVGSCAISSGTLDCDLGVVGVNATVNITVNALVAPSYNGANLGNTATVTTDANDLNPADNTASTTNVNAPLTNVSVTLQSDTPAVISGQNVQFTAVVTTAGPSDAYNVVVSFPVPDGLESITVNGATFIVANGIATGVLGHTVVGSITLAIKARVSPAFLGTTIRLAVAVSTETTETTSTDNTAAASAATTQYADVKISKKASVDTATYGDSLTYTLHVVNNGPSNALHAKVVDDMPKGLAVQTVTSDGFTCSWSTLQVVCTAGSLPVGTYDIEVVARIVATGVINNTASATADVAGTSTERPSAIVEVPPAAKLIVTKEPDKKITSASDQVVYTITVHNDGPDVSPNVKVLEPLNYALFLRKAEVSQGEYSKQTGYWSLGDLPAGATATLLITARVNVQGIIKNEIAVADDYMRGRKQPPIKVVASVYSKGGTELPITGADVDHTLEIAIVAFDLGILLVAIAAIRRRRRAAVGFIA